MRSQAELMRAELTRENGNSGVDGIRMMRWMKERGR